MRHYKTLRGLFADAKRWTKDTFAENASGDDVKPKSKDAVCFCLIGGVRRVYPNVKEQNRVVKLILEALGLENIGQVFDWNDARNRSVKDVQKLVAKLKI